MAKVKRPKIKTVAVTGADGFIGRSLIRRLKSRGARVVILKGDIRKPRTWQPRFDLLYHCAAAVPGNGRYRDADFYSVNVDGTLMALEVCRKNRARMVFLSTSGVYKPKKRTALKVDDPVGGASSYARSKCMAEELCRDYALCGAVSSAVLRVFNVYGPGQNQAFIIPYLVTCAKTRTPAKIKHPHSVRDFIYVSDVTAAMLKAGGTRERFGVYNIGTGKGCSLKEAAGMIGKAAGTPVKLKRIRAAADPSPYVRAAITPSRKMLKWTPRVGLKEGIRQMFKESASG